MRYKSYLPNHVVLPGSEKSLHTFLNTTLVHSDGTEEKHKLKNACNSNSEDALTNAYACKKFVYERQRLISYKPNPVSDFLFFCRREVEPLWLPYVGALSIQRLCLCFSGCFKIG